MKSRFVVAGIVAVPLLLFLAYRSWWSIPVAQAEAELISYTERLARAQAEVRRGKLATEALEELRTRTLGGDEETVDHRVRTQLNRLLESLDVAEASVTTTEPKIMETPARSALGKASASLRRLRDEPDFATLEVKIGGVASVANAMRLLTELRAQTWPCRIDDVRLDPLGEGARLRFAIRCTTMFLLGPDSGEPTLSGASEGALAAFADFAKSNPFALPRRSPKPAPAQASGKTKRSPPSPSFPYERWRLTGVAELSGALETWWVRPDGNTVVLRHGATIGQATIAFIEPEAVILQRSGRELRVEIGRAIPR